MSRPSTLLLALLLASVSGILRAQADRISIPAWIESGKCGPTPDFVATFNGKPSTVIAPLGPGSDEVLLLILDFTGDVSLVDSAKEATAAEIAKLPANTWVGLLNDQDGLHVLADPSPTRQAILDSLKDVPTTGKPGVLSSVTSALSLADSVMRKSPVRVSVLYLTDGNIYNYREDYTNPVINGSDPHDLSRVFPDALIQDKISKLAEDISYLEAPLFIVHLNYRGDTLNESYQNGLLTLADATGGKGQVCRSVGEIPDAIAAAFARIANGWRLTMEVPPKFRGSAQIRLSLPCGGEDARLSWRTRVRLKEE